MNHESKPEPAEAEPVKCSGSWFQWSLSLLVATGSVLTLGLFLFSNLGRYFFLAELLGNFRFQILILLLLCLLITFVVQLRWLNWLLVTATLWCCWTTFGIYLPSSQPTVGSEQIRILSMNVLSTNSDCESVLERIADYDPDIIVILEYANHWPDDLQALVRDYPHQVLQPRWHGFGIALFSKFPLHHSQVHQLSGTSFDNPMIEAHIKIGDQMLRIAGLHVVSPTNFERMLVRNNQLENAASLLKQSDSPTIVVGDFNGAPWSPFLQDFLKTTRYRDSRQGQGYQASWHTDYWLLQVPIDQAFVSSGIHVHDRQVLAPVGSDHLPISVDISLSPN